MQTTYFIICTQPQVCVKSRITRTYLLLFLLLLFTLPLLKLTFHALLLLLEYCDDDQFTRRALLPHTQSCACRLIFRRTGTMAKARCPRFFCTPAVLPLLHKNLAHSAAPWHCGFRLLTTAGVAPPGNLLSNAVPLHVLPERALVLAAEVLRKLEQPQGKRVHVFEYGQVIVEGHSAPLKIEGAPRPRFNS